MNSTATIWGQVPNHIQHEISQVESEVSLERGFLQNYEVNIKMRHWVLDIGTSHARESKYLKTVALYWKMKTLMGKVILEEK